MERGFEVIIATCTGQSSPLVDSLRSKSGVEIIQLDEREVGGDRFPLDVLLQLRIEKSISLNFFVDADDLRWHIALALKTIQQLGPSLGVFLAWFAPFPLCLSHATSVRTMARYIRNRWNNFLFFGQVLAKYRGQFQAFVLDLRLPIKLK